MQEELQRQAAERNGENLANRGAELWRKAKTGVKPLTLSQRLRHAEEAVGVLVRRLQNAGLEHRIDGSDPDPNDDMRLMREKLEDAQARAEKCGAAEEAARAATKRARDAEAALEALRSQLFAKSKEVELSAQAGALARKEAQRLRDELQKAMGDSAAKVEALKAQLEAAKAAEEAARCELQRRDKMEMKDVA